MKLNLPNIPGFDNSNIVQAAIAVVVLGVVILAITFIVPILGSIILIVGLLLIAYIVFKYLQNKPPVQ